ncbi:MAG: hypothetical protein IPM21_05210 [Acidobacteria bacterium]|nr:hypothetical protein [Acidobacteriota bacterium]
MTEEMTILLVQNFRSNTNLSSLSIMELLIDQNLSRKLVEEIGDIFPEIVPRVPLINHKCEDCLELQNAFSCKSWKEISTELLRAHFANLPLFSPEAFHAFIPAYLVHSIENLDGDDCVSEFTAYAFLPDKVVDEDEGHRNWWVLKLSFFSDEQFNSILGYLDLVEATDEYFDRDLMKRGRQRLLKLREESQDQS